MDCNITKNYLSQKAKMRAECNCFISRPDCDKCPLSDSNNGHDILCTDFECEYPEEAIKIVQKWSDSHKLKTYLDDFIKKYPNAPKRSTGEPFVCVKRLYGVDCKCGLYDNCTHCWNQPMKKSIENNI